MLAPNQKGYERMKTTVDNHATATAPERWTTGSVTSKDGTTIGYRQIGRGPGVVLVHGIMERLADTFTVYLPDRRGRGRSGPQGKDYRIQKEVEDLDALLAKTGAHQVFGVSAGALICLQAALTLPAIHKAAIFEPPLLINGSLSTAFLQRFDEEMVHGDVASALVTAMQGSQMGPPVLNVIPRWLLELLTRMMTASEAKKADVTMTMLAPTLQVARQCALAIPILGALRAEPAELPCLPSGFTRVRDHVHEDHPWAAPLERLAVAARVQNDVSAALAGGTAAADGRAWEDHEAE
jgi:pimeloyl-ACP methyl ester carboxylesterase